MGELLAFLPKDWSINAAFNNVVLQAEITTDGGLTCAKFVHSDPPEKAPFLFFVWREDKMGCETRRRRGIYRLRTCEATIDGPTGLYTLNMKATSFKDLVELRRMIRNGTNSRSLLIENWDACQTT